MILAIAKNEFLQFFRSHKLTITMLVCCTLMPLSIFMMLLDYDQRYENYTEGHSREVLGRFEFEKVCGYGNRFTYPDNAGVKKPSKLSIFSKGIEDTLSGTLELESNWLEPVFGIKQERNIYVSLFGSFDLLLVTKVAIGLLAIILGCSAVVSERQEGTLALILSHRIGRTVFIIGKFLGGISIVLVSYISGLILSLLLVELWPTWSPTLIDCVPLMLIFIGFILYLVFSYLLGMVISCLCRTTATASIVAVVVWVITVVLLPLLMVYCAEIIHEVPSFEGTLRKKIDTTLAMLEEAKPHFGDNGNTKYGLPRLQGELGESLSYKEAKVMRSVDDKVLRAEQKQIGFARSLLALVPSGALTNMLGNLTGTSPENYPKYKSDALKVAEAIHKRRFPTINQWIEMFRGNLDPEQFDWGRHKTFSNYIKKVGLDEEKVTGFLKNPMFSRDSRPLEVAWLWPDYDFFSEAPKYIAEIEPGREFSFVDLSSLTAAIFVCFSLTFCLIMRYDVRPT